MQSPPELSEEKRAVLRHTFDEFDENGDGAISIEELDRALLACGFVLMEDELDDIMSRFDKKKVGTLCFDDFCVLADQQSGQGYADGLIRTAIQEAFPNTHHVENAADEPSGPELLSNYGGFFDLFENLNEAFEHFDEDGDGTISVSEIGNVLRELGQTPSDDELRAFVAAFDDNESGALDFDEFANFMVGQVKPDGVDHALVEMVSNAARKAISERKSRRRTAHH